MRPSIWPFLALAASVSASSIGSPRHAALLKREDVCADLRVNSNNGDRKVAIVIDSSGSMASNDPSDRRLDAGRALNEFLISNSEASGDKKADAITIIDFDDSATLVYPLGDPGNANASFSQVDSSGGTFIASGVNMAIDQLTKSGTGTTEKRSAIVVFTDGQDSSSSTLVSAINKANAAGIRVSFGFLDTSASSQGRDILRAVRDSRGVYATITTAAGSINFINYVLLNGLTYNDNPQGYDSQLLAGLSQTYTISGANTVTLKYSAQQGESITFRIVSISAGTLSSVAQMGGSTVGQQGSSASLVTVTAPSSGQIELKVTARSAGQDGLFSVTTGSNVPLKNCTVGVGPVGDSGGLSAGAKAGIGVGVTVAMLGLLGAGGYYAYKHFHVGGSGGGLSAPPGDGGLSSGPGAGNTTMGPNGVEKVFPHTDAYPIGPDGANGLAPTAPGQGGFGAPAGGGGGGGGGMPPPGGGQVPMGMPPTPGMAMPLAGGGGVSGAFVPVFVPPMFPPGSPNSQNTNVNKSSPSLISNTPLSSIPPSHSPYQPTLSNSPPPQGFGSPYGQPTGQPPMGPDGFRQNLTNSMPPQELGGGQGGVSFPGSQGGISSPSELMSPNHTGSTFQPSNGGTGPLPPGHGDLGPHNHTGGGISGSPPAPGSCDPTGPGLPGPGPSPGPGQAQVFVPSSGSGPGPRPGSRPRHHHHPWLPQFVPCEDRNCQLHSDYHPCYEACECVCRENECPLNK